MNSVLQYSPQAREGIEDLIRAGLKHIAEKSILKISANPYSGKKLTGKLDGLRSARITRRYRVIYQIFQDTRTVLILDVSHRKESYR